MKMKMKWGRQEPQGCQDRDDPDPKESRGKRKGGNKRGGRNVKKTKLKKDNREESGPIDQVTYAIEKT